MKKMIQPSSHRNPLALATALAAALSAQTAAAQSSDLGGEEYLAYLRSLSDYQQAPIAAAPKAQGSASTIGIPSGFTLPKNTGFVALALSDTRERKGSKDLDGSAAFGLGFGDAASGLGFEAILGLSSVGAGANNSFDASDFGDSGSLNLKFSRLVPSPFAGGTASVAFGVGRAFRWGDMEDEDPNYYGAWSSTFSVPTTSGKTLPGLLTAGYGSAIGTNEDIDGAFLGLGLGVTDWLSVGGSWYGDEVQAGITTSFQVRRDMKLQIGVSYGDVGHQHSDGRWLLSVALVDFDLF